MQNIQLQLRWKSSLFRMLFNLQFVGETSSKQFLNSQHTWPRKSFYISQAPPIESHSTSLQKCLNRNIVVYRAKMIFRHREIYRLRLQLNGPINTEAIFSYNVNKSMLQQTSSSWHWTIIWYTSTVLFLAASSSRMPQPKIKAKQIKNNNSGCKK